MSGTARKFSAFEFCNSNDPYGYMLECGFGSPNANFSRIELSKLSFAVNGLPEEHKAFAFAIAENFGPRLFRNVAIDQLSSSDLSVRLSAYNCLIKLARKEFDSALIKRIREAISDCPERESMDFFDT